MREQVTTEQRSPVPAGQSTPPARDGKERIRRVRLANPLPPAIGLLWLLFAFLPVLFMLVTSLKTQDGFLNRNSWLPPLNPTLENYTTVLQSGFALYLLNSVVTTAASVLLIVIVSLLASYAIARIRSRLVFAAFNVFIFGLAIPVQAALVPLYALIGELRLYDTLLAMIFPYVAFGIPLSVLILVNFIRDIPNELYDSLALDGGGQLRILWSLVIPLSRPALVTVAIYQSIQVWNGFVFPLVLTQSPNVRVLPLALWTFQGEFTINVPLIMAAVSLSALPLLLFYIVGRRQLLAGLTAGFNK